MGFNNWMKDMSNKFLGRKGEAISTWEAWLELS